MSKLSSNRVFHMRTVHNDYKKKFSHNKNSNSNSYSYSYSYSKSKSNSTPSPTLILTLALTVTLTVSLAIIAVHEVDITEGFEPKAEKPHANPTLFLAH